MDALKETTAYPGLKDTQDSMYGTWYIYVDDQMIAYSGRVSWKCYVCIVLVDSEYKSTQAYQLLKEIQKEAANFADGDIESQSSLNGCKDAFL